MKNIQRDQVFNLAVILSFCHIRIYALHRMIKSINRKVRKAYRKDRKELTPQGFKLIDFASFAHS
jgi:hypothetical protein